MVGKRVVQSQGQLFFLRRIYGAIRRQTCAPFGHVQLVRSHQGARFSLSCLYLHRKTRGLIGRCDGAIRRRCLRFPLLVYVYVHSRQGSRALLVLLVSPPQNCGGYTAQYGIALRFSLVTYAWYAPCGNCSRSLSCLYLHRKSVVIGGVRGALYFAILRRCLRFPLLVYVILFYQKFLSSFRYSIKFTKDLRKKSLNL